MAIELALRVDQPIVTLDGQPLSGPTPLADLPQPPALQADSYGPGRALCWRLS